MRRPMCGLAVAQHQMRAIKKGKPNGTDVNSCEAEAEERARARIDHLNTAERNRTNFSTTNYILDAKCMPVAAAISPFH